MSGLSIIHLRKPEKKYDPARVFVEPSPFDKMVKRNRLMRCGDKKRKQKELQRECWKTYFETPQEAREEDRTRRWSLFKQLQVELVNNCKSTFARDIRSLINLFAGSKHSLETPKSCASSRYMRSVRRNLTGALCKLMSKRSWENISFFTIAPRDWVIPAEDLHLVNPAKYLENLRHMFNRQGATKTSGWMIVGFDGEFDDRKQVWVLHVHGLATGGMIDVVDAVRKLPRYRSSRKSPNSNEMLKGAKQKVRRTRKRIKNNARIASYILKSFWPRRDTFENPFQGEDRQRRKRRLPEPQHTQFLLWMERWTPVDLTLMMGLRVTRSGLRVTNMKTNTNENSKGKSND